MSEHMRNWMPHDMVFDFDFGLTPLGGPSLGTLDEIKHFGGNSDIM